MPVVVESVGVTAESLVSAMPSGVTTVPNLEGLKAWLAKKPDEYAVVLGPSVDMDAASDFADNLRLARPATSVILVRDRVSTSVLAGAMHAGMREVVEERDLGSLKAAVDRARQVWTAIHGPSTVHETGTGRLITVFSPKGGVGKTTTAVNLALALADRGSRRVCLVDLDLAFGDVAITLQLFPTHTIQEAVPVEEHLDFSMLETLLTPHEDLLMVLAAPTQPDAKDSISGALVSKVLQTLKENFEYVVVDTSPNFESQVLQAFDETDECVLVATLDVPTLKNVKIAMETLDLLNVAQGHRWLVLNRADDQVGLAVDKVEGILGMSITTAIPSALEVATATNSGRPIITSLPDHPVSRSIRLLAGSIIGSGGATDQPVPDVQKRTRFAWQRR